MNLSCQRQPSVSDKIYQLFRVIPKGPKFCIWFRKDQFMQPSLFLFPLSKKQSLILANQNQNQGQRHNKNFNSHLQSQSCNDIEKYKIPSSFDPMLSIGKGTLCQGTLFHYNGVSYFTIEDVHFVQSNNVPRNMQWCEKYAILFYINSFIKPLPLKQCPLIGLPITRTKIHYQEIETICKTLPYNIYAIEYMQLNQLFRVRYTSNKRTTISEKERHCYTIIPKQKVFIIKPDTQNDIYRLYDGETYIDTALVPDIKTSKYLNKEFRNIREDSCLDLVEESDDEEEFENVKEDKYMKQQSKPCSFNCVYNSMFKKWVPLEKVCSNL